MYKSAFILGFFLLFAPSLVFAATPFCSSQGYTVVYINGIFDTEFQAKQNRKALADQLPVEYNGQPVTVQLGYNPSHLAGAGDLAQLVAQTFGKSVSNFDLTTILMQVYPEVTTRKLLLVGHSQGAFYTNDMYYYLLAHGEPAESVAVYNVASPAAYTAGHGKYINSSGDEMLSLLRALNFDILPNNAALEPGTDSTNYPGHAFTDYLSAGGTQMVAVMGSELSLLKPTDASENSDCFTPPVAGLGYKTEAVAFAFADPSATILKAGTVATVHAGTVALKAAATFATAALQLFADSIIITTAPPTKAEADQKTLDITNKLYGSSLEQLSPKDKKELLGNSQGAALPFGVTTKPKPKGVVLGTTTITVDATTTAPAVFTQTPAELQWFGGGPVSTPTVVTDTAQTVAVAPDLPEATTITDIGTTTPVVPPIVEAPLPLFKDSFDAYDASLWHTVQNNPNGTYIRFAFDSGSTSISSSTCRSGACISTGNSGTGGLGGGGHTDYMYQDTGAGGLSGAYSIWGRSTGASNSTIGVCTSALSGCGDSNSSIQVTNILSNDNTWHRHYVAWRQGSTTVEYCYLKDDVQSVDCDWNASNFPPGTGFNAFLLIGFSSRVDLGDISWFDDLEALSTVQ